MKTYELKVNLNEGLLFRTAEWRTIGIVSAKSKADAEEKFKRECHGGDFGIRYNVDMNLYSGMKVKAFVA